MNDSSPFNDTQRTLFLFGAGAIVLLACSKLLKAYHPYWRRDQEFRFEPLGWAVFLFCAAGLMIVAARAITLIAHHPLVFPTMMVVGCAAWLVANQLDEWRKGKTAVAPANQPLPAETPGSELRLIRAAVWYARLLVASLIAIAFSLFGQLFGPEPGLLFFLFGVGPAIAVFILSSKPLGQRFLRICPQGLSGPFAQLQSLRAPLLRVVKIAGACAFLSIAVMFAGSRGKGGGNSDGQPVFATRERYMFYNHGERTEVTQLRYRIVGTAATMGFHSGIFLVSTLALYGLIFGQLPKELVGAKTTKLNAGAF